MDLINKTSNNQRLESAREDDVFCYWVNKDNQWFQNGFNK